MKVPHGVSSLITRLWAHGRGLHVSFFYLLWQGRPKTHFMSNANL